MGRLYQGTRFTDGYREIMSLVRMSDFDDPWGTAMEWCFSLAETVYVETGDILPDFDPSPALTGRNAVDTYPALELLEMLDGAHCTIADMKQAFTVMSRYEEWCRLAGRNY